jgi:hypothetical protein
MLLSSESSERPNPGLNRADEYVGKPYEPAFAVSRADELIRGARPLMTRRRVAILIIDDSPTGRSVEDGASVRRLPVTAAESGEDRLRLLGSPSGVVSTVSPGTTENG